MTGLVICRYMPVFCKLSFVVCYCRKWSRSLEKVIYTIFLDLLGKLYVRVLFVNVFVKIVFCLTFKKIRLMPCKLFGNKVPQDNCSISSYFSFHGDCICCWKRASLSLTCNCLLQVWALNQKGLSGLYFKYLYLVKLGKKVVKGDFTTFFSSQDYRCWRLRTVEKLHRMQLGYYEGLGLDSWSLV